MVGQKYSNIYFKDFKRCNLPKFLFLIEGLQTLSFTFTFRNMITTLKLTLKILNSVLLIPNFSKVGLNTIFHFFIMALLENYRSMNLKFVFV